MGAGISQFPPIDESSLVTTGLITSCSLYSVHSSISKLVSFKETSIIQYKKDLNSKLPDKLTSSATFKAFIGMEFAQNKLIENSLRVKHLSHPSIIRVVSAAISPKISSFFLVSEPTLPFQNVFSVLTEDEFLVGIYSILQAIDFLHNKAHISHNNIDITSLFVDSKKKWKLGLFELSCAFSELSQHRLEVLEHLKNKEEDQNSVEFIASACHGYDIYCFSRMVTQLLSVFALEIDSLKTVLERSGMHASPKQRPSAAQLLKHSVFTTPFSHLVSFLSEYMLKSDAEKIKFFQEFPKVASDISEEVLCSSIVPLILVPSIFTDFPAKSVVRHLLTPHKENSSLGLVSEATFTRLVVPQISRLFRCHELTTRMLLLQHFQAYARFMGRETLKTIVLPEICMSVYDANEDLAAASLSGVAHLAHLLGTGLVMSHFQSLGAQMESLSFLTPTPLSDVDKASLRLNTTLTTAPTKKPLVYTASKKPWRRTRTSFFPDSAPKSNRQVREPPAETPIRNGSANKTSKLADLAVLSPNYVPLAAPVKRVPSVGPPVVQK
ncbi:unnamed protein product [Rodentolepis nana]|uniref:Protein kinase domain-containing protein n=1 Tax=Rodentolepis nana TaxID=102285 RepID=A0A0R3TLV6_RODNA|nr:unnamed protein product [Rodentolepis nana]